MNFQHLPAQLAVLILGWIFTLYLQYLSNRRTEALKRKDRIIDKLAELAAWTQKEIDKDGFDPSLSEEAFTALILHVELRINQLNKHIQKHPLEYDVTILGELRNVDFFNKSELPKIPYFVHATTSSLIEHMELLSDKIYFNSSLLQRFNNFKHELNGVFVAFLSLLALFILFHLISELTLY